MLQSLADTLVLGSLLEELRTRFGPYELVDARSELREEFRERQCGGGWKMSLSEKNRTA